MSIHITSSLRQQVRGRFQGCCAYCRTPESLVATTFEIEHIVPRSAGGETILDNLCLACPTCNRHKASFQVSLDPLTNQLVLLFNPNVQSWADHFRWDQDDSKIIGTTSTGRATVELLRMNRPELTRMRKLWTRLGEFPPD